MARKLKIVKFPKSKVPNNELITTMIDLLRMAREGNVRGFALVALVGDDGEEQHCIRGSSALNDHDRLSILGAIRRLEHRFIKLNYNDD